MNLIFDPISSPGATRDLFVDLTAALEVDETLSLATVVSAYTTVLTVSNVAINDSAVAIDDQTVEVGKGVHFTIQTVEASTAEVPLVVSFEGNSGTIDKYEIAQPIVASLCQ